jgi:hypothetical protein
MLEKQINQITYEDLGGKNGEICPEIVPNLLRDYVRELEPDKGVELVFPDTRTLRTLGWRIQAALHCFDKDSSKPHKYEYNVNELSLKCTVARLKESE